MTDQKNSAWLPALARERPWATLRGKAELIPSPNPVRPAADERTPSPVSIPSPGLTGPRHSVASSKRPAWASLRVTVAHRLDREPDFDIPHRPLPAPTIANHHLKGRPMDKSVPAGAAMLFDFIGAIQAPHDYRPVVQSKATAAPYVASPELTASRRGAVRRNTLEHQQCPRRCVLRQASILGGVLPVRPDLRLVHQAASHSSAARAAASSSASGARIPRDRANASKAIRADSTSRSPRSADWQTASVAA